MSNVMNLTLYKKEATIHHVTNMLAISENVLFPGPNHLLITGTDDLTLWLSPECQPAKWMSVTLMSSDRS